MPSSVKKIASFTLQRYSSDKEWNLWFFQENFFLTWNRACSSPKSREKIQIFTLTKFEQRSLSRLILSIFVGHQHNPWHWLRYWWDANNYRTFRLWVRAHCENDAKSLVFVISGVIQKCKCINNLMLILVYLQFATSIKTRLWHRCFLAKLTNFVKL